MARQASNNLNKFKGLEDSPAIQGIERIYEANEEAHQKRVAEALEQQQNGQAPQRRTLCHRLMPLRILQFLLHHLPLFRLPNMHQRKKLARRLRTASLSMCR